MADKIDSSPFKIVAADTAAHEIKIDPSLINNIQGPITVRGEVTTGTMTFSVGKTTSSQSGVYAAASNKTFSFTLPTGISSFFYKANAGSDAFVGAV